ncbi:MAG TPA: helix-turn-helix transcriptional regulator [Alphaproteobacteria bacterium]|nr:helix-turn-helix transcriptional regulator [Alphaproteobacteria bacterium]
MTTLKEKIASLPPSRRKKIGARAAQLMAEELTLQDLRKAIGRTQTDLAKKLDVGQDTVSRVERRTDLLLSTLRGYVTAMGGELDLIVRFPRRPPVHLIGLGILAQRAHDEGRPR